LAQDRPARAGRARGRPGVLLLSPGPRSSGRKSGTRSSDCGLTGEITTTPDSRLALRAAASPTGRQPSPLPGMLRRVVITLVFGSASASPPDLAAVCPRPEDVPMWVCPRCRERHEEHFEVCWACGEPRGYSDLPDQVTCDGTRLLSPTEAEELAAREALAKKAWHPHEEHQWQATAGAHRFASRAGRVAAGVILALGLVGTLLWGRDHA